MWKEKTHLLEELAVHLGVVVVEQVVDRLQRLGLDVHQVVACFQFQKKTKMTKNA